MQNNFCDGSGPCSMGEVRVLPWTPKDPMGGNSILCRLCFSREIQWRIERNPDLAKDCQYDLPKWESLKVYGQEAPA